jgi:hypothetical protein
VLWSGRGPLGTWWRPNLAAGVSSIGATTLSWPSSIVTLDHAAHRGALQHAVLEGGIVRGRYSALACILPRRPSPCRAVHRFLLSGRRTQAALVQSQ